MARPPKSSPSRSQPSKSKPGKTINTRELSWLEAPLRDLGATKQDLQERLGMSHPSFYRELARGAIVPAFRQRVLRALEEMRQERVNRRGLVGKLADLEKAWERRLEESTGSADLARSLTHVLREAAETLESSAKTIPLALALNWLEALRATGARLHEVEQHYRFIERYGFDVIWMTDLALNFTYHSPSVKHLRNLEPDEANRLSLGETLTEQSLARVKELFLDALIKDQELRHRPGGITRRPHQPRPIELENKTNFPDKHTVWVEVNASFIRDAAGVPTGIIGVSREISERRGATKQLLNLFDSMSNRRLVELFEEIDLPMALVNRDMTFFKVNSQFTKKLHYGKTELCGKEFNSITVSRDQEVSSQKFNDLLAGKDRWYYHIKKTYLNKEGDERSYQITVVRLPKAVGQETNKTPAVLCVLGEAD